MSAPLFLLLRAAIAIALYAFLGFAFLTLWNTLSQDAARLKFQKTPPITIHLPDTAHPQTFTQSEILIGRARECALRLEDDTVSARHARLSYHHGQWWVEDLGSKNGSTLNGETLTLAAVLTTGDEIGCGKIAFTVELGK